MTVRFAILLVFAITATTVGLWGIVALRTVPPIQNAVVPEHMDAQEPGSATAPGHQVELAIGDQLAPVQSNGGSPETETVMHSIEILDVTVPVGKIPLNVPDGAVRTHLFVGYGDDGSYLYQPGFVVDDEFIAIPDAPVIHSGPSFKPVWVPADQIRPVGDKGIIFQATGDQAG